MGFKDENWEQKLIQQVESNKMETNSGAILHKLQSETTNLHQG